MKYSCDNRDQPLRQLAVDLHRESAQPCFPSLSPPLNRKDCQMENFESLARRNQRRARELIRLSGVREAWESIGAEVNLIGSLATGLLAKHRDIDFHVYTDTLEPEPGFRVLAALCANPAALRCEYRNLAATSEECLEWHLWYLHRKEEWQIDMIQIRRGSCFDGYFERVAQRIRAVLTPETRRTILELKYLTPDNEPIRGIEYCQAVIADGVRSWAQFADWRHSHPQADIVTWIP